MRLQGAIVGAFLISLAAATFAFGDNKTPPAPEAALMGIGIDLPPLSNAEHRTLEDRANAGDLKAMYELAHHALHKGGGMYFWGSWGDVTEAERWWRRAATLGDPKAMVLLGHMYAEPWGVEQDLPKAAEWFKKAADLNNLEAVQSLVHLYIGVWSNERDDAEANRWILRAVSMGDRHAMLLLGLRYDAGWGVREDPREAAGWYEKVIAGGRNEDHFNDLNTARNNLGALYEEGRGVPKDEHRAAELYSKAAQGWSAATYNLAVLCEAGRGVQQDKDAAAWLYREAALHEIPEAIAALKRLGFKVPTTFKESEDEAAALLAHDKEKKANTICDP